MNTSRSRIPNKRMIFIIIFEFKKVVQILIIKRLVFKTLKNILISFGNASNSGNIAPNHPNKAMNSIPSMFSIISAETDIYLSTNDSPFITAKSCEQPEYFPLSDR